MKLTFLFVFSLVYSFSLFAVPEKDYQIIYSLVGTNQYQIKHFTGVNNFKLSYLKLGDKRGKRGALLINTGRNESSQKYLELAYDFKKAGYSPVYVFAHRGQGLSQRALKDQDKGHVDSFSYYVEDLKKLTKKIRNDIGRRAPLYNISHSMGGAITLRYLQKVRSQFNAVAFLAPMFKLKLPKSERFFLKDIQSICTREVFPTCTDYIQGGGPAKPVLDFSESEVTSSRVRFDYQEFLYQLDNRERIGSPTYSWAKEAIKATMKMRLRRSLRKVSTPFKIYISENETVVSNDGAKEVCRRAKYCTKMVLVKNALHSALFERDQIRTPVLRSIDRFFKSKRR